MIIFDHDAKCVKSNLACVGKTSVLSALVCTVHCEEEAMQDTPIKVSLCIKA